MSRVPCKNSGGRNQRRFPPPLPAHSFLIDGEIYDAIRAFAPVSLIGIQPTVVIASPSRGFMTLADLVAAATAKPGTFASAGVGSASHMAAERLRVAAAIDVRHIPFRGAEGLTEVMAGRVDFSAYPIAPASRLSTPENSRCSPSARASVRRCCRTCRQSQRPAIRTPSKNGV